MVTKGRAGEGLTSVERSLVEHVIRGEVLYLPPGTSGNCRASVIRDILCGRLAAGPDPHGLRLRAARVTGRLDLEKLISDVYLELTDCFLDGGLLARDARLPGISLVGCHLIGHAAACAVDLHGAQIGQLDCTGAVLQNDSGPALYADGLQVDQYMFLRDSSVTGAVRLPGAHIGRLECDRVVLRNYSGPALYADGLQVDHYMLLRDSTVTGAGSDGAVNLLGAHIGRLECDRAVLRNDSGPALIADGLQVDQAMFLRVGFTATGSGSEGAVRLPGAHIGGDLNCTGASLRNDSGPALIADGLQVGQSMLLDRFAATCGGKNAVAVDLTGARVGGTLVFKPARLENLIGFHGRIWVDSRGRLAVDAQGRPAIDPPDRLPVDPHGRLAVDELTYAGVPDQNSEDWLLLQLREGTRGFAAQPYQQLAAGHRALGNDQQVRKVLIAQRDDQLAGPDTRLWESWWGRITKVTLGYGYKPWRALWFLAGVVLLSCLLAIVLGWHGALAQTDKTATPGRPCTLLQKASVGLDLNLPIGQSVARQDCDLAKDPASATAAWLTAAGWVLQLLAWAFAALFIAGFTSAVRKT